MTFGSASCVEDDEETGAGAFVAHCFQNIIFANLKKIPIFFNQFFSESRYSTVEPR